MKIWKLRHGVRFPSFYLELVVLHALSGSRKGDLANNVLKVLSFLAGDFAGTRFQDPANSANWISDDLDATEKRAIKHQAASSLAATNWSQIVW